MMRGFVKFAGTYHAFPGELDEFSMGFDLQQPRVEVIGSPAGYPR